MQNKNSSNHRIPLNTFSNFFALLCQMVVSFFMAPFLVHRLGDSAYGVWAIVLSIFGYMGILDLGVTGSLVRHVAGYDVEDKRRDMGMLLSSALLFYVIAGVVGALVGAAIGVFGMSLFNIPDSLMAQARLVMVVMGLSLAVRFPGYVFLSLFSGLRLYYKTRTVEIAALLLKSTAVFLAIRSGKGLVWLGIITVCSDSLKFLTIFLLAKRRLHGTIVRIRDATRKCIRELLSYGLKVFCTMGLRSLSSGSDYVLIGIILSSRWVTFFSIPFILVGYLKLAHLSVTRVLMPVFSNLESRNMVSDLRFRVLRYSRYLAAILLFAGIGVFALGEPFIRLWMGPGYAARGALVLSFLCLSFMLWCLAPCSERLLMGTGNQHILLSAAAVHSPVRLGLSIALIYPLGISGVALADVICEAGLQLYLLVRVSHYIGVSVRDYFRQTLFRPMIAAGAAGLVLWGTRTFAYPRTYPELVTEVALACALYAPLAYAVVLTRNERRALRRFLKHIFSFLEGRWRLHKEEASAEAQARVDETVGTQSSVDL